MAKGRENKNFIVESRGKNPKMVPNERVRIHVRDYLENVEDEETEEVELA